jgi:hypothetical protein
MDGGGNVAPPLFAPKEIYLLPAMLLCGKMN